jgi:hypothetical protein
MKDIPAILIISNVTYGRKGDRFLYKCITCFNETLYVAYDPNKKQIFQKNYVNKYILVNNDSVVNCHISKTIGLVSDIEAFYEYNYHVIVCKYSLVQLPILQPIAQLIAQPITQPNDSKIYTIDPIGSDDLDDAFSLTDNKLKIMIANVPLNSSTHKLSSTIYSCKGLKNIHMIKDYKKHSLLADKTPKNVLCLEINLETREHKLYNTSIIVDKNLNYDSDAVIIQRLIETTKFLNNNFKKLFDDDIVDSHKSIEYIMIYFGLYCANILAKYNCGIFRISEEDYTLKYIKASYTTDIQKNLQFNDYYVHITSPIRRLVDCINMNFINCILLNGEINNNITKEFIDSLNIQQHRIKKLQVQLQLLELLEDDKQNDKHVYKGTIVGTEHNKYVVKLHIESLSNGSRSIIIETKLQEQYLINSTYNFVVYLFENKTNFKQKIKIRPQTWKEYDIYEFNKRREEIKYLKENTKEYERMKQIVFCLEKRINYLN